MEALKFRAGYKKALKASLEAITRETIPRLARYLREYALTPNPSPLLREALTLSLESIPRASYGVGSWGVDILRLGPEGVEVVLSTRRKGDGTRSERLRADRLEPLHQGLMVYGELPMGQQVMEALRTFKTRVEGILEEAQALSERKDPKEVLPKAFRRLWEAVKGLRELVKEYPFAQEYLPKGSSVLELGGGIALGVDFDRGGVLLHRTSKGDWARGIGKEVARFLHPSWGRSQEEIQALVEFAAILGQTYREAQERVRTLLEGEEGQQVGEAALAARISGL